MACAAEVEGGLEAKYEKGKKKKIVGSSEV